jgi:hypothetical protein
VYTTIEIGRSRIILGRVVAIYVEDRYVDPEGPYFKACYRPHERAWKAGGARNLLPGSIYNYGVDAFPELSEDSPSMQRRTKGPSALRLRSGSKALLQTACAHGLCVLETSLGRSPGRVGLLKA